MRPACLLATLALLTPLAAMDAPAQFQDGQRVVFYGASTVQGGTFHAWMQLFYATRFPERRIRIENAGVGGSTAAGSLVRIERDVLARRPGVVWVMFGVNDTNRSLYRTADPDAATVAARERAIDTYRGGLETTLGRITASGAAVVLLTPTAFDQFHSQLKSENSITFNDGLARASVVAREVAAQRGCPSIDVHTPLTALLRDTPGFMPAQDRIHMDATGHLVLAYLLLKAQAVPGVVARAGVDAAAGKVTAQDNCTVSGVRAAPGTLSFVYQAKALPFPLSKEYTAAAALVPWGELNRETLQVSGLKPGEHRLRVGGLEVGTFSAAALAAGVDLAALDTPQQRQAQKLREAVLRKVAADGPLRSVAKMEDVMASNRIDPADRAAADRFLDAFPATSGSKAYYEWEIANYRKARDNAAANAKALEDAFAGIHALQVVAPVEVEILAVR